MNCLIDTWRRLVARSRQICGHAWFLARRHHPERLQPLAILLLGLKPWEEANLVRDQLCPRVENCWDLTLNLNTHLSKLLYMKPNPTRDDLRLNRRRHFISDHEASVICKIVSWSRRCGGQRVLSQHRRRPAWSRDHPAGRGPEAAAGLRRRCSEETRPTCRACAEDSPFYMTRYKALHVYIPAARERPRGYPSEEPQKQNRGTVYFFWRSNIRISGSMTFDFFKIRPGY